MDTSCLDDETTKLHALIGVVFMNLVQQVCASVCIGTTRLLVELGKVLDSKGVLTLEDVDVLRADRVSGGDSANVSEKEPGEFVLQEFLAIARRDDVSVMRVDMLRAAAAAQGMSVGEFVFCDTPEAGMRRVAQAVFLEAELVSALEKSLVRPLVRELLQREGGDTKDAQVMQQECTCILLYCIRDRVADLYRS